jgi:hypothetical protein
MNPGFEILRRNYPATWPVPTAVGRSVAVADVARHRAERLIQCEEAGMWRQGQPSPYPDDLRPIG